MSEHHEIPAPPTFTDEERRRCRESGDFCPMFFEWYKFVGALCNFYASIRQDSPAVRSIEPLQYAVLIGSLNRCSRLMLANVALSHEGLFGETTAIIDRCIFESCVRAAWLCHKNSTEYFTRFVADGLKTELEFKAKIKANVSARDGQGTLEIEKRMIASIERHLASSGLTDIQIADAKKLPDIAAMIEGLVKIGLRTSLVRSWGRITSMELGRVFVCIILKRTKRACYGHAIITAKHT